VEEERVRSISIVLLCMALGNVKTEVPESAMREGEMASSIESEAETAAAFASKTTTTPLTTATLVRRKVSSGGGAAPTSSVHELLECPVCTNSMYPPIHQVSFFYHLSLFFSFPEI
jgi:hypothetical protein